MIDALIYGVILIANMVAFWNAPPDTKLIKPNSELFVFSNIALSCVGSSSGTGIHEPSRKIIIIPKVYKSFFLRSAIFHAFLMVSNILYHLYLSAGCKDFFLCCFTESLSLNGKRLVYFAAAENNNAVANLRNNSVFLQNLGSNFTAVKLV